VLGAGDGPGDEPDEPDEPDEAPRRAARLITGLVAAGGVGLAVLGLLTAARAIQPAARPSLGGSAAAPPTHRAGLPAPTFPVPTTSPPADTITLAFAGDVHFQGRVATRLAQDPATALGPVAGVLGTADVAMVNLETSITGRGTPEPKEFTFRAPASAFTALRQAGVDVASMANNHAADFGRVGLDDTLAAIAGSRFPTVGIGRNAGQAYSPYLITTRGHTVAILAASQVRDRTLSAWTAGTDSPGIASAYSDRLLAAVRLARQEAEIVVVYLHWGVEGDSCPTAEMRSLASTLSAAGADAVVGTHAHLLLGAGYLGRTYVDYGLGNFLWWRDDAFSNDTGVLRLTFRGRQVVAADLVPARIDDRGVPVPATGGTASRIRAKFAGLQDCTELAALAG
jgi:poly-gamma-glutamate synthesis protein (capsule biosynthesis protein)